MDTLTEEKVREIVRDEIAKSPVNVGRCNVTLDIDGKKLTQLLCDDLRRNGLGGLRGQGD